MKKGIEKGVDGQDQLSGLSRRELLMGALQMGTATVGSLALAACGNSMAAQAAMPADAATSTGTGGTSGSGLPAGNYRVDVHTHHIPDFYRLSLASNGVVTAGGIPLPAWSPDLHLGFMNSYGIQMAMLSISEPGVIYLPDAASRLSMAQQINDYTTQLIKGQNPGTNTADARYADRFGGFACMPLGDTSSTAEISNTVAEISRALNTLGMDGIGLFSNYKGVYLGDPAFTPIFEALNALNAVVFLHPVTPSAYPDLKLPTFLYEFTFDTTRAVVNMLYHQVFKTYPNIRWILSHAGGCVPFLSYRTSLLTLTPAVFQNLEAISPVPVQPGAIPTNTAPEFAQLYYDTALSPVPAAMKSVREVAGVSHTLFATDWPFSNFIFPAAGAPTPLPSPLDPEPQLSQTFTAAERIGVERNNYHALFSRISTI